MSKSTLNIFRLFHRDLPGSFPADRREKMQQVLVSLESDPKTEVGEVEKALASFGYEAWPWHKAKKHFWQKAYDKLAEHFFVPKLSEKLKEKYDNFTMCGGKLHDIRSGASIEYFGTDERRELIDALTQLENDLSRHVESQIGGLEKEEFLDLVDEYKGVADKIKAKLVELRMLAHNENDHEDLSNAIKEKIKLFEHGWCYLAPEPQYHDVCEAVEFFQGRKHELNRMRGAHLVPKFEY